jgi:hypothetical protein
MNWLMYFMPTMVAFSLRKRHRIQIFIINSYAFAMQYFFGAFDIFLVFGLVFWGLCLISSIFDGYESDF